MQKIQKRGQIIKTRLIICLYICSNLINNPTKYQSHIFESQILSHNAILAHKVLTPWICSPILEPWRIRLNMKSKPNVRTRLNMKLRVMTSLPIMLLPMMSMMMSPPMTSWCSIEDLRGPFAH